MLLVNKARQASQRDSQVAGDQQVTSEDRQASPARLGSDTGLETLKNRVQKLKLLIGRGRSAIVGQNFHRATSYNFAVACFACKSFRNSHLDETTSPVVKLSSIN